MAITGIDTLDGKQIIAAGASSAISAQQASTQANPPANHSYTFTNCGRDTPTGAAELAQIPSGWK